MSRSRGVRYDFFCITYSPPSGLLRCTPEPLSTRSYCDCRAPSSISSISISMRHKYRPQATRSKGAASPLPRAASSATSASLPSDGSPIAPTSRLNASNSIASTPASPGSALNKNSRARVTLRFMASRVSAGGELVVRPTWGNAVVSKFATYAPRDRSCDSAVLGRLAGWPTG